MQYYYHRRNNYGALTDLSKSVNEMLGDQSGRTVSLRTAHGFRHVFNAHHIDEDNAEGIVHAGMLTAGILLKSENEEVKATGALLSLALLICYQAGK